MSQLATLFSALDHPAAWFVTWSQLPIDGYMWQCSGVNKVAVVDLNQYAKGEGARKKVRLVRE